MTAWAHNCILRYGQTTKDSNWLSHMPALIANPMDCKGDDKHGLPPVADSLAVVEHLREAQLELLLDQLPALFDGYMSR